MKPLDLSKAENYWEMRTSVGRFRLYTSGTFIKLEEEGEKQLDQLNWIGVLKDFKHYREVVEGPVLKGSYLYVWINDSVFKYTVDRDKWCAWDPLIEPWDLAPTGEEFELLEKFKNLLPFLRLR